MQVFKQEIVSLNNHNESLTNKIAELKQKIVQLNSEIQKHKSSNQNQEQYILKLEQDMEERYFTDKSKSK